MNQDVIDEIDCPVCDSPKGVPCTRNDDGGCGMRLDDFIGQGSYEARLRAHKETMEAFVDDLEVFEIFHQNGTIFLSDDEFLQLLERESE